MKRTIQEILFTMILASACNIALAQIDTNAREIPWQTIKQADILYKKRMWREIPVYEKRNAPLRDDPRMPQENVFANVLLSGINAGVFTAYAERGKELKHPLTIEEVNELTKCDPANLSVGSLKFWNFCLEHKNDSVEFAGEDQGTDSNQVILPNSAVGVASCKYPLQIDKYRIAEDWIYDKGQGQMILRIVAIAPVANNKALFWLSYPEIRKYIAHYEAYKVATSRRYMWDEYFESRQFMSKIIKVGEPVYSSKQKK